MQRYVLMEPGNRAATQPVMQTLTLHAMQGSGDDHIAILAWKRPEGESRESPQHLIPRVMKFIRRGSPTVTSKGLAEELHNRWCVPTFSQLRLLLTHSFHVNCNPCRPVQQFPRLIENSI